VRDDLLRDAPLAEQVPAHSRGNFLAGIASAHPTMHAESGASSWRHALGHSHRGGRACALGDGAFLRAVVHHAGRPHEGPVEREVGRRHVDARRDGREQERRRGLGARADEVGPVLAREERERLGRDEHDGR